MSIRGSTSSTSIRKKTVDLQTNPAYGLIDVLIHHEASVGDTHIDFTNLNPSSTYTNRGFSNPSTAEITALRMSFYEKNVSVKSSSKGELMLASFRMVSNTQLNFIGFTAEADETFEILFKNRTITGTTIVNHQPYVKTGTLAEGATSVLVDAFEYNKFPTYQQGALAIYRGTTLNPMLRNVNNAVASPTADGNYQEVAAGNGRSQEIKFNISGAVGGEPYLIISVGSIAEDVTESMLTKMETVNGSTQKLIEVVAQLSGQTEGYFEGQPNSIDTTAFAERLVALENLLNENGLGSINSAIDLSDPAKGIILQSASGTLYKMQPNNTGNGWTFSTYS